MSQPPDPTYALVDDLIDRDPLILGAHLGMPEAAAAMTASGSGHAAVPVDGDFAVLSDAGIRSWVASGRPAASVGTQADHHRPCVTLGTSSAEAMITMLDGDADCVLVVDAAGGLRGIITARDFLVSPTTTGVSLHQQLRRAASLDELRRRAGRLPHTLRDVSRRGLATSKVIAVHSSLIDTIVRRTIDLVLLGHDDLDPAAFTWLSLGSNGRREAVLSSDIDAAVAFEDGVGTEKIERYRSVMGEIVGELARAGLTSDDHGATPAHRLFARTDAQWMAAGRQWLADPTENKGAVFISLLVDSRPIHGSPGPTSVAQVFQELRTSPSALRILLQQSLVQRARLRSVRTLLSRRQDLFNVKDHALAPIVNLARWAALSSGSSALSTIERLRTTAGSAILPQEEAATLIEIFEVLQRLRLRYQLAQLDAGEPPTDLVSIDRLSPIDRSVISQAVREISAVQRRAANLSVSAPSDAWLEPS
ncbi:MAG TPA: putative nucleotidyltransferase substrate binding domain-containing protein [Microlunatus sp.]